MARTIKTILALFLTTLILTPAFAPLVQARPPPEEGDAAASQSAASEDPLPMPSPTGIFTEAEGWLFLSTPSLHDPLGRASMTFNWQAPGETFTGTLRLDGWPYTVTATRDTTTWMQDEAAGLPPFERYVGTAERDQASYPFLLDYAPSEGYAGGFVQLDEETRYSFHLYDTPARSLLALRSLLDASHVYAHIPETNPPAASTESEDSPLPVPIPPLGGSEPFEAGTPEAQAGAMGPSPIDGLLPRVPWAQVPDEVRNLVPSRGVGVPYIVVNLTPTTDEATRQLEQATANLTENVSMILDSLPVWDKLPFNPDVPGAHSTSASSGGGGFGTTSPEHETGDPGDDGAPPPPGGENKPPTPPGTPLGPWSVPVGQAALYEASGHDPDLGPVNLMFDWGDNTSTETSALPTDAPQKAEHTWTQPGRYPVRVQARDTNGGRSAWSASLFVDVNESPLNVTTPDAFGMAPVPITKPNRPPAPTATNVYLVTGENATFTAKTSEPAMSSIKYDFDWDVVNDENHYYTPWVANDQAASLNHSWSSEGTRRVTVQAINTQNGKSEWSQPLNVVVQTPGGLAPNVPSIVGDTLMRAIGSYTISATDPDSARVRFNASWGDGTWTTTDWKNTGSSTSLSHTWNNPGTYTITVQARDDRNQTRSTTLSVQVSNNKPLAPTAPQGWDVLPQGSEGCYSALTTDPDGDKIRYEFNWGDGTGTSLSGLMNSGQQGNCAPGGTGGVGHAWSEAGSYNVTVRAVDQYGMRGNWSTPFPVEVGEEPFEFVLENLTVSSPTPAVGEDLNLSATVENRAANAVVVDVTFYDDNVPICSLSHLLDHAAKRVVDCTHQAPGALGKGTRQLWAKVNEGDKYEEVRWTNNQAFLSVRMRDPVTGPLAYGALYDGPGPTNPTGHQLQAGLFQKYRTPDENTFDELDLGGAARPMRLLLWSSNLTNTNKTTYFTQKLNVTVEAPPPAGLAGARPNAQDLNQTLTESFPIEIGYSSRVKTPTGGSTMGLDYKVSNKTTFSFASNRLAWDILTPNVPSDQEHALGVQFDLSAGGNAAWRTINFSARLEYLRVEREANSTLSVWYETLRAGTAPMRASVQAAIFPGQNNPYPAGADYNFGDRSMTSQPVWDAEASSRRTYFDGVTDKAPKQEGEATDTSSYSNKSNAYYWFRLDGPVYHAHTFEWRWFGPGNNYASPIVNSTVYRLPTAEEEGYGPGSFWAWAQLRSALLFPPTVEAQDRGTWYARVYIDSSYVAEATFHLMANSDDPTLGPRWMSDEEYASKVGEQEAAAERQNPQNKNLDHMLPDPWQWLNESRVDQELRPVEEPVERRADNLVYLLINSYLADQAQEAFNITNDLTDDLLPGKVPSQVDRVVEKTQDEAVTRLREFPQPSHVRKTITRTVWSVVDKVLNACELPSVTLDTNRAISEVNETAMCLTQHLVDTLNATKLVDDIVAQVLQVVNETLEDLLLLVDNATGLVKNTLDDPLAAVNNATQLVPISLNDTLNISLPQLPLPPPPATLHPANLAELGCIDAVEACPYEIVMQTQTPVVDSQEQREETVATLDSLFYNIYATNGVTTRVVRNVPILNLTLVDLDNNTSTGLEGNELRVMASLARDASLYAQLDALNASRATPSLRIENLDPSRELQALVCAYFQLPTVPYVATSCVDTRQETLSTWGATSRGLPDIADLTMSGLNFDTSNANLTANLQLETSDQATPEGVPVFAAGSFFRVDMTKKDKPRVLDGDHADATLYAPNARGKAGFSVSKTYSAQGAPAAKWTWSRDHPAPLEASYEYEFADRTLTASSHWNASTLDLPESIEAKASRPSTSLDKLDVTTQRTGLGTSGLAVGILDQHGNAPLLDASSEAFSLNAATLPATLALRADDAAGTYTLAAAGPLDDLRIRVSDDQPTCAVPLQANAFVRTNGCTVLNAATLQAATFDLASGGPNLTLAGSTAAGPAFLAKVDAGSRTLEALLSQVPEHASLQSNINAQGRSTLTWTASERVEEVGAFVSVNSTVLSWTGSDLAPDVQAAYAWDADTIRIETRDETQSGSLGFLLTNTGMVPRLPQGDYLTGKKEGSQVQAAASLTRPGLVEASLATENIKLGLDAATTAPFAIRYARSGGSVFALDATGIPAEGLSVQYAGTEGGAHRLDHQGATTYSWNGVFPQGPNAKIQLNASIESAPSTLSMTATPKASTFDLTASGGIGRMEFSHTPAAVPVDTLAGNDVVHLGLPVGGTDVYRANLGDLSALQLAKTPGSLTVRSTPTTASPNGLTTQIATQGMDFLYAHTASLASTFTLAYGRTGATMDASSGTPEVTLRSQENGNLLRFHGEDLPAQGAIQWAQSSEAMSASVTRTAGSTKPTVLEAEALFTPAQGQSDFVRVHVEDAPATTNVAFDGTKDEVTLSTSERAGLVLVQHAANAQSIQLPSLPQYLIMRRNTDASASSSQALRIENVSQAILRLGANAGQENQLLLDASSTHGAYVEYARDASQDRAKVDLHASLSNLPGFTDLRYALGTFSNANGLQAKHTSTGTINELAIHALQAGLVLDLAIDAVSPSWNATWAPGQALEMDASTPLILDAFAYRPEGENAPKIANATDAYATIDGSQADQPRLGLQFPTGITLARLDPVDRVMEFANPAGVAELQVLHKDLQDVATLDLAGVPSNILLRATASDIATTAQEFAWNASAPTTSLSYGLDAPNARWRWDATSVPGDVGARFDATTGEFNAHATGGAGPKFTLRYVDVPDPSQPVSFLEAGEGLVLFAKPTGPEGYPPQMVGLTLNLSQVETLSTKFPPTSGAADAQPLQVALTRGPGATPTLATVVLAAGPKATRIDADGVNQALAFSWNTTTQGGMQGTIHTDTVLSALNGTYRGPEGTASLDGTATPTNLGLLIETTDTVGDSRLNLAYEADQRAGYLLARLTTQDAVANLTLENAPQAFRVDAPLACHQENGPAQGHAWLPSDEPDGTAVTLAISSGTLAIVPDAAEAQRLVAACDGDGARLELIAPGFQDATWESNPTTGTGHVSLQSAATNEEPVRFIARGAKGGIVLDALAGSLPGDIDIQASTQNQVLNLDWNAAGTSTLGKVFFQAPDAFAEFNLTNVPSSWGLASTPLDSTILRYRANGPAGALGGQLGVGSARASIAATELPPEILWETPLSTCASVAQPMHARVWTNQTGYVGDLRYTLMMTDTADVIDDAREFAAIECDNEGFQSSAHVTGLENVEWHRALVTGTTSAFATPHAPTLSEAASLAQDSDNGLWVSPAMSPPRLRDLDLGGVVGILNEPTSSSPTIPALPSVGTPTSAGPTLPTGIPSTASSLDAGPTARPQVGDTFDRNAAKPSPESMTMTYQDTNSGTTYTTTMNQPGTHTTTALTAGTDGTAEYVSEGAGTASLTSDYTGPEGNFTAVTTNTPGLSQTSINGAGVEYQATGNAGSHEVYSNLGTDVVELVLPEIAPPKVYANVTGEGNCKAWRIMLDTANTGVAKNARFAFLEGGSRPPEGGPGVRAECEDGVTRTVTAHLPELKLVDMSTSECKLQIKGPVSNHANMTYVAPVGGHLASVTVQTALGEAILDATLDQGNFDFVARNAQTNAKTALSWLGVDLTKLPLQSPAAPGGMGTGCLEFGDSPIENLTASAQDATGAIHLELGKKPFQTDGREGARSFYFIQGDRVDTIDVDVELPPHGTQSGRALNGPTPEDQGDDPTAPFGLEAMLYAPIDNLEIKYHEGPDPVLVPDDVQNVRDHIFISTNKSMFGGTIHLAELHNVSVLFDKAPAGPTNANVSYVGSEIPLKLMWKEDQENRAVVELSGIPSGTNATFRLTCPFDKALLDAKLPGSVGRVAFNRFSTQTCEGEEEDQILNIDLQGIPAGDLKVGVEFGAVGRVSAHSSGGSITWAMLGITLGDPSKLLTVALPWVKLDIEWDLDGDTNYTDAPYHIYATTNGIRVGAIMFDLQWEGWGIGIGGAFAILLAAQFRMDPAKLWTFNRPVDFVGTLCVAVPVIWVDVIMKGVKVPVPIWMGLVSGCAGGTTKDPSEPGFWDSIG